LKLQVIVNLKIEQTKSGIFIAEKSISDSKFESQDAQKAVEKAWDSLWWAKKYLGDTEWVQKEGEELVSKSKFKEAKHKYSQSVNSAGIVNTYLSQITDFLEDAQKVESQYQTSKSQQKAEGKFCFLFWCW